MEIVLTKKDTTNASIKITLNEADYQPKVTEIVKDYAKNAQIKGFRPGKVPVGLIKKMYGQGIIMEEVSRIISQSINAHIRENKILTVGEPIPSDNQEEIDWKNAKEFTFHFDIGMASDFEVKLDDTVEVNNYHIQIGDKELDEVLTNLRERNAQTINPEVSEDGDFIYGSVKQVGGDFEQDKIAIPTQQLQEETKAKFVGLKVGDAVNFVPSEVFKGENAVKYLFSIYDEKQIEELSAAEFTIEVNEIVREIPAELNEDLFQIVFPNEEITDLEAFKNKVKEEMGENYRAETDNLLEAEITEKILEVIEFDLPQAFLKKWLLLVDDEKLTEKQIEEEFEYFEKHLRWSLITRKLKEDEANQEALKVEKEDIKNRAKESLAEQLRRYGLTNLNALGNLDEIADKFLMDEDGKNFQKIYDEVQDKKVIALLKDKIKLIDKEVSLDEFADIVKEYNNKYDKQVAESTADSE